MSRSLVIVRGELTQLDALEQTITICFMSPPGGGDCAAGSARRWRLCTCAGAL
jgi:hypothetical protein